MNYVLFLLLFLSHLLSYLRNSPQPVELKCSKACLQLLNNGFTSIIQGGLLTRKPIQMASLMAIFPNIIFKMHAVTYHVRVGAGNDLLRLSDMLDTWSTNY